jgi:large subunit ribosomal protein L19
MLLDVTTEAVQKSKEARPKVWRDFTVGDAVEVKMVASGGVKSHNLEKIRGVVLGIFRRGLDSSVLLRDVVFGVPVERRVPLHSPLLRSIKVLESNFVYKGRRKVKRAKLYFLRNRNPLGEFELLLLVAPGPAVISCFIVVI